MPLKTKIMSGFAAICLIFVLLATASGLILNQIKKGTEVLNSVIMPNNDVTSELKYAVTY